MVTSGLEGDMRGTLGVVRATSLTSIKTNGSHLPTGCSHREHV